jgi:hypothetical protein
MQLYNTKEMQETDQNSKTFKMYIQASILVQTFGTTLILLNLKGKRFKGNWIIRGYKYSTSKPALLKISNTF